MLAQTLSVLSTPTKTVDVAEVVSNFGRRTFDRLDQTLEFIGLQGIEKPRTYTCAGMVNDIVRELSASGIRARPLVGTNRSNGRKEQHIALLVNEGGVNRLYDPAFGIFEGFPLDRGAHILRGGTFRGSSDGEDVFLENTSVSVRVHFSLSAPQTHSFVDERLTGWRNFPNYSYSLALCLDEKGILQSCVSVVHGKPNDLDSAYLMINVRREEDGSASFRFEKEAVRGAGAGYREALEQAALFLGYDPTMLHMKVLLLLDNVSKVHQLQGRLRQAVEKCGHSPLTTEQRG